MENQTATLSYFPKPKRRPFRLVIRVLVLVIGIGVAARFGGPAARHANRLYWQAQCLNYDFAPNTVVYESDATVSANLLSGNSEYHVPQRPLFNVDPPLIGWNPPAYFRPREYDELFPKKIGNFSRHDGVAYLHERKAPDGKRWLVVVSLDSSAINADFSYSLGLFTSSFEPVSYTGLFDAPIQTRRVYGGKISLKVGSQKQLSILAGSSDPEDSSKFSVTVVIDGVRHQFNGSVAIGGRVSLEKHADASN